MARCEGRDRWRFFTAAGVDEHTALDGATVVGASPAANVRCIERGVALSTCHIRNGQE